MKGTLRGQVDGAVGFAVFLGGVYRHGTGLDLVAATGSGDEGGHVKHIAVVLALALGFAFASNGKTSSSIDPHECDRLAADPDDLQRTAAGVTDEGILPDAAIAACASATSQDPGNARYWYQYHRALMAGQRADGGDGALQKAAAAGHPGALFYVAVGRLDDYWAARFQNDDTKAAAVLDEVRGTLGKARAYPPAIALSDRLTIRPEDFRLAVLVRMLMDGDISRANRARFAVAAWAQGVHDSVANVLNPDPECPATLANPAIVRGLEAAQVGDPSLIGRLAVDVARTLVSWFDPIWMGEPQRWLDWFRSIGVQDGWSLSTHYGCGPAAAELYSRIVRLAQTPVAVSEYAADVASGAAFRDVFPELTVYIDRAKAPSPEADGAAAR